MLQDIWNPLYSIYMVYPLCMDIVYIVYLYGIVQMVYIIYYIVYPLYPYIWNSLDTPAKIITPLQVGYEKRKKITIVCSNYKACESNKLFLKTSQILLSYLKQCSENFSLAGWSQLNIICNGSVLYRPVVYPEINISYHLLFSSSKSSQLQKQSTMTPSIFHRTPSLALKNRFGSCTHSATFQKFLSPTYCPIQKRNKSNMRYLFPPPRVEFLKALKESREFISTSIRELRN